MPLADTAITLGLSPAFLITITVWTLFWKGVSLWHSARNKQKYWFIALLIINTVGLLEVLYLFFFRADRKKKSIFGRKKTKR